MPMFEVHTVDGQKIQLSHTDATPEILARTAAKTGRLDGTEIETISSRDKREYPISISWHAISTIRSRERSG